MPSDPFIPLSVPNISGREWQYVKECLDTGWVSSAGPQIPLFESAFADRISTARAVACVNGTAALHVILHSLGVGRKDAVLVSDLTFIASANAIRYTGAEPVFIDVDDSTWQIDPARVREFLVTNCEQRDGSAFLKEKNLRVAAIMPVHILGIPVDMDPILELAQEFNLEVIEDATESLGATYKDRPVGSHGVASAFSFNGNKLITTGGGGMVCTSDEALADRIRYLTTQAKQDEVEFVHGESGFNYRLTNLQAAMGRAQLEQLDAFLARKRAVADFYRTAFADLSTVECMPEPCYGQSAAWLFTIRLRSGSSRSLMKNLASHQVQSRPLWQPMHLSPAFQDLNPEPCPVSAQLNRECLSLPCSTGITDLELARVASLVREWATQVE